MSVIPVCGIMEQMPQSQNCCHTILGMCFAGARPPFRDHDASIASGAAAIVLCRRNSRLFCSCQSQSLRSRAGSVEHCRSSHRRISRGATLAANEFFSVGISFTLAARDMLLLCFPRKLVFSLPISCGKALWQLIFLPSVIWPCRRPFSTVRCTGIRRSLL